MKICCIQTCSSRNSAVFKNITGSFIRKPSSSSVSCSASNNSNSNGSSWCSIISALISISLVILMSDCDTVVSMPLRKSQYYFSIMKTFEPQLDVMSKQKKNHLNISSTTIFVNNKDNSTNSSNFSSSSINATEFQNNNNANKTIQQFSLKITAEITTGEDQDQDQDTTGNNNIPLSNDTEPEETNLTDDNQQISKEQDNNIINSTITDNDNNYWKFLLSPETYSLDRNRLVRKCGYWITWIGFSIGWIGYHIVAFSDYIAGFGLWVEEIGVFVNSVGNWLAMKTLTAVVVPSATALA